MPIQWGIFISLNSVSPFLAPGIILLLPVVLTIGFGWAVLQWQEDRQRRLWAAYRGLCRFILIFTVAVWWVIGDSSAASRVVPMIHKWQSTLGVSSSSNLLFWVPPIGSVGLFLTMCYLVDKTLRKLKWTITDLLGRAWWRVVSLVIPLLMVAAGFDDIFDGKVAGLAWLLCAAVVSRLGTGFLRRAEGMRFNKLKTGELRNRALRMASEMGVTIGEVYMVPAGKGHLTNAFGMSNAIAVTDSLGKYLTKPEADYVLAHEIAHVKLKHSRKHLLVVIASYSALALSSFHLSQRAFYLLPVAQLVVILGPLAAIYFASRRFEYSADEQAVKFTGEPETAIRGLAQLSRIGDVPDRYDRFTELFATHPSLERRVQAIASRVHIAPERLADFLKDVRPAHGPHG